MWAQKQKGFTIVELLIVILVIGILAAITIVAYNGVQERARVAALTTDLAGATKQLALFEVDAGNYPATLAEANNGQGIKASAGTTYQYTSAGSTYCLTATKGTSSYKVSNDATTPTPGGCAGHGIGGVAAITNLATNPSAETNASGWSGSYGTGGAATSARVTTTGQSGTSFYRATITTAPTSITTGGFWVSSNATAPAGAGKSYTATGYLRTSWAGATFSLNLVPYTSSWAYAGGEVYGPTVTMPANTWTRLTVTMPAAPAGTENMTIRLRANGGTLPVVNSTMDGDALTLTEGPTVPNYADGNTANWVWNGTANNSTSTGPPV
jgi:prepilin-type N-terminal cleavage/methylation domain-containing protein